MSDELTRLREEMSALHAELTELRRDHRQLLDRLGLRPDEEGGPTPPYLHFDAECIAIREDKVRLPIVMRAHEDHASIVFMDQNSCVRAEFIIDAAGFRFETRNAQHELTFQLAEAADGSGQMCVCDGRGRPRAGMRVNEHGGVVNVIDPQGKPQAFLLGTPTGGEVMTVSPAHQASATMKATLEGGLFTVHEPGGQLMGFLSGNAQTGGLSIYGPHGMVAATMVATDAGGGIVFNDINGDFMAKLPEEPAVEEPDEPED